MLVVHDGQLEVLSDFFEDLDQWKRSWGQSLTLEQERKLYLLVSETLQASGKASEAQRLLVKFLATFTDADTTDLGTSSTHTWSSIATQSLNFPSPLLTPDQSIPERSSPPNLPMVSPPDSLTPYRPSSSCSSPPAEIHPYAVKGVIGAIKEPIAALTSVSNLLSLKPIKQLEGHPKFKKVFELLQVRSPPPQVYPLLLLLSHH